MMDSDSADSDLETATDERKHLRLISAVTSLDKKNVFTPERTEVAMRVSEFHVTRADEKVKLHELVGALKKDKDLGGLKTQLNRLEKKKQVVDIPLPKPQQERISRAIAYDSTKKEVSKWGDIVQKNRKAEQLEFPIQKPSIRIASTEEFVKRFKASTPLEQEVAALLSGGKQHNLNKESILTRAEEKALRAMNLEEAQARREELQKYRALLSYREAKLKRQKKIKSKRYHRILRKEKVKNEQKAIDELQKKDPEAYTDKVLRIEKDRVKERMSLKHRGGSKFMLQKKMFSKYNDNAREAIQEMIQKGQELTKKTMVDEQSGESDEEIDLSDNIKSFVSSSNKNPWMSSNPRESSENKQQSIISKNTIDENVENDEIENFLQAFKQVNPKSTDLVNTANEVSDEDDTDSCNDDVSKMQSESVNDLITEENDEPGVVNSLTRRQRLEDFEGDLSDTEEPVNKISSKKKRMKKTLKHKKKEVTLPTNEENTDALKAKLDPDKFLTLTDRLEDSDIPMLVRDGDDEEIDSEEMQRITIAQAFAADDVVDEFISEKRTAIDDAIPKDVDLSLPGWGEWGGEGVRIQKKKKKRFIVKAPDRAPRKDRNLNNVIISEKQDPAIVKHQVRKVPFPFSDSKQFESSIRAPVGKHWNTELSYRELIKPKVITKIGQIIEPIDKKYTFKKTKKRSRTELNDDLSGKSNSCEKKLKHRRKEKKLHNK